MFTTLDLVKDPLTTKAAAEMLAVSRWAILRAIRRGKLTAESFGRDYAIEREEVERYARERKMTGPRKLRPTSEYRYPMAGDITTSHIAAER